MPGWTVGDKRVPPFRAPAFGDPMPFDDEMGQAAFAQVLAHRQPGLATANDECLDLFNGHARYLFALSRQFQPVRLEASGEENPVACCKVYFEKRNSSWCRNPGHARTAVARHPFYFRVAMTVRDRSRSRRMIS